MRKWLRRLAWGATFVAGAALAGGAVYAYETLPLRGVSLDGLVRADSSEVLRLVVLPDTTVPLFSLDPRLLADRVQRHPWVREARVRRLPTGTLAIRVVEREPVALVLGGDGRPRHWLDREGYALPLVEGAAYDVPLLRGALRAAQTGRPSAGPNLVGLLGALAAADDDVDALVSEITLTRAGDATLRTPPVAGHPSLAVRLGAGAYDEKLRRLRAFWDQAVLPRPGHPFRTVDLRFDGQVVTREGATPARPAADTTHSTPAAEPPPIPPDTL